MHRQSVELRFGASEHTLQRQNESPEQAESAGDEIAISG